MYTGNNPSALRSQKWLTEALFTLMQEKNFASISVKEICKKADLTRQTFYQFFTSKEDVVRLALSDFYAGFEQKLIERGEVELSYLVETFFRYFQEKQDFVRLLISNGLDHLLTEQFSISLPKVMNICIYNKKNIISDPHISCFVVSGLSAMVIHWLKSENSTEEKELAHRFLALFAQ